MTGHIGRLLGIVAAALAAPASSQQAVVDVRQGTDIAIAVAPDKQTLVVDLLGQLWSLPTSGGGATPLTPVGERAKHPRFSPEGSKIAYQRFIDGQWDLWLFDVESGRRRALTQTRNDEREPDFLDDDSIVFASNVGGNFTLWALELSSGQLTQLTSEQGNASFPTVADSGAIAYVRQDSDRWSLRSLSRESGNLELYSSSDALSAPSWRPGAGVIVFHESDRRTASRLQMLLLSDTRVLKTLVSGEDVFAVRPAWVSPAEYLYAADGQIWRRGIAAVRRDPVHLFAGVAIDRAPAQQWRADFDDDSAKPALGIAGLGSARDVDQVVISALGDLWLSSTDRVRRLTNDPYLNVDPAMTADGSSIVFASDRAGQMSLWQMDLRSGELRPLTMGPDKAFAPAISTDGTQVAYLETEGMGPWAPSRLHVLDLETRETLASSEQQLLNSGHPAWVKLDAGEQLQVNASALGQSAVRQSWVFDNRLQLIGRNTSARSLPAAASQAATAPTLPEWRRQIPQETFVIQAGRVFDGVRGSYRRHMDIFVDGHRIAAIVGRDVLPLPERVIDARDKTVVPGFIDIHVHQSQLAGERLGRIWLASGVTTVREIAANVPEAVARSEIWASAAAPGPRLLVSPTSAELMSLGRLSRHELLMPAARDRMLDGPLHDVAIRGWSMVSSRRPSAQVLAEQTRTLPPVDYRSSPLQAQYQDVYGTILGAGLVTGTAIASASAFSPEFLSFNRSAAELYTSFFTPSERAIWQTDGVGTTIANQLAVPRQNRVARLIRSGARVAIGTDAPAVPYGTGIHAEFRLLAEAGIPNDQILRVATIEGALALGLDRELGTLETGKLADMLIIDGDPLRRIGDAANIDTVFVGGRRFDRLKLLTRP